MTQDRFLHSDAAYVLGILDDDERREFEAHLETCLECTARVAEVRPTAALLAGVPLSAVIDSVPMPDTLLPSLLREARRDRNRRRLLTGSLAALAAACVATLVVVLWPSGSSGPTGPAPQAFAAVRPGPVTASAQLVAKKWGTEIDLNCRYVSTGNAYVPYHLVVIDKAHHASSAGSWTLVPGRDIHFTGGTSVQRQNIARVQITLADGTPILQLAP
jgi:hypothetical protein